MDMLTTEQQAKADQIAWHYGLENQLKKLKEELGELMIEVDLTLQGDGSVDGMVTELADVEIMVYQIGRLMGMSKCINHEAGYKIDRQLRRMSLERYKN